MKSRSNWKRVLNHQHKQVLRRSLPVNLHQTSTKVKQICNWASSLPSCVWLFEKIRGWRFGCDFPALAKQTNVETLSWLICLTSECETEPKSVCCTTYIHNRIINPIKYLTSGDAFWSEAKYRKAIEHHPMLAVTVFASESGLLSCISRNRRSYDLGYPMMTRGLDSHTSARRSLSRPSPPPSQQTRINC